MLDKIQKILFSLFLISLLAPFVFPIQYSNSEFTVPDLSLMVYPISMLVIFLVYSIWTKLD